MPDAALGLGLPSEMRLEPLGADNGGHGGQKCHALRGPRARTATEGGLPVHAGRLVYSEPADS